MSTENQHYRHIKIQDGRVNHKQEDPTSKQLQLMLRRRRRNQSKADSISSSFHPIQDKNRRQQQHDTKLIQINSLFSLSLFLAGCSSLLGIRGIMGMNHNNICAIKNS